MAYYTIGVSSFSESAFFGSGEKSPARTDFSIQHKPGLQTWGLSLPVLASRWHASFVNITKAPDYYGSAFSFLFSTATVASFQKGPSLMPKNKHPEKNQENKASPRTASRKPRTFTQLLVSVGGFVIGRTLASQKPQRKRKPLYE